MAEEGKGLALITGGAKRLGRLFALALAEKGWDIALHYNTSEEAAREVARLIRAEGRQVFLVQADLAKEADQVFARLARQTQGPVTALINNASLFVSDKAPEAAEQRQVNTLAPLALAQAFEDALPASSMGSVIHILDGTLPAPTTFSLYEKSKRELEATIKEKALKSAPRIRINGLKPGPTLINPRESRAHFESCIEATPLKKASLPEDLIKALLFLLDCPSLTGAILPVDGGRHLKSNGAETA